MVKRIGARLGLSISALLLIYLGYSLKPSTISAPVALAAEQATVVYAGTDGLPPVIAYQARLLDAVTGQPKPDGAYTIAFNLYTVATAGSPLWSEVKNIPVNKGLLSTLLGDTTPLNVSLFNGQKLYLGITVGSDPEMAPRQPLAHVPYAIHAETAAVADSATTASTAANADNANRLNGQAATAFASASHSHAGDTIVDNSLTTADLADGAVTTTKLADGAVTESKLATGTVPKFFSLDPMGAFLTTGATMSNGFGPNAGIHLADAANGSFYTGFTIPPNFTTGGTLVTRLLWHTSATGCSIAFVPNAISVARLGRKHITGGTTGSGLTVIGGNKLFAPTVGDQTNETRVTITSPDGVTPLQAGDSVIFSLFRSGSDTADSCAADMVIQSISVTY